MYRPPTKSGLLPVLQVGDGHGQLRGHRGYSGGRGVLGLPGSEDWSGPYRGQSEDQARGLLPTDQGTRGKHLKTVPLR